MPGGGPACLHLIGRPDLREGTSSSDDQQLTQMHTIESGRNSLYWSGYWACSGKRRLALAQRVRFLRSCIWLGFEISLLFMVL